MKFKWNVKISIFLSTTVMDCLIIFYSIVEPPHTSDIKNGIYTTIQIFNDLNLYLISFFILKQAAKKNKNKHEFLFSIKMIFIIGLVISFWYFFKMVLLPTQNSQNDKNAIYNLSIKRCANPFEFIDTAVQLVLVLVMLVFVSDIIKGKDKLMISYYEKYGESDYFMKNQVLSLGKLRNILMYLILFHFIDSLMTADSFIWALIIESRNQPNNLVCSIITNNVYIDIYFWLFQRILRFISW